MRREGPEDSGQPVLTLGCSLSSDPKQVFLQMGLSFPHLYKGAVKLNHLRTLPALIFLMKRLEVSRDCSQAQLETFKAVETRLTSPGAFRS